MLSEQQILALIAKLPCSQKNLIPGDDIARFRTGKTAYAASDSVIENVHFRHAWVTPAEIAHKLFARNWSDFLCKGIKPGHALLNLALSRQSASSRFLRPFLQKLSALMVRHHITLIGGDTARSESDVLTLTFIGSKGDWIPRRGAGIKRGDTVLQIGGVGGSDFARHLFESKKTCPPKYRKFFATPAVFARLPRAKKPRASIDQSDSVEKSLRLLAEANAVNLHIDLGEMIPSHALVKQATEFPANMLAAAEDLAIFVIAGKQKSSAAFRVIGSVESIHVKKPAVHYHYAGQVFEQRAYGFEHFR